MRILVAASFNQISHQLWRTVMNKPLTILGIAGSLRKSSFNRMALRAAQQLAPDGAVVESFELDGIPLFNQDLEQTPPPTVVELKKRIRAADAILLVTPEYNYSVPGVMKNAIDWAARPSGDNSWNDKPVAVMSVSPGAFGGVRAQYALRQSFVFLNMHAVNRPEVMIAKAHEKFDASGNYTDEGDKKLVRQLLENLVAWTKRVNRV
jgi:chromate reductase, NAD(P)H dehydrogenase (quinone)